MLEETGTKVSISTVKQVLYRHNQSPCSAKGTGIGLLRTGVKSFSLMIPLTDCLGHPEKNLVRRRQGECYHPSCVMPTVKHPETIHVWGCFSAKGVGSLTILPKNSYE